MEPYVKRLAAPYFEEQNWGPDKGMGFIATISQLPVQMREEEYAFKCVFQHWPQTNHTAVLRSCQKE
jgi:hypothetical protein